MAGPISVSRPTASRVAITVMKSGSSSTLCPFFGKCDGILIVDADAGATEFYANPERTASAICDLIVAARPGRLICGFIGDAEKQRLLAARIDVRLGSCVCAVEDLVASFHDLAAA